jgi:outer membrane factor, OMF family
MNHIRRILSISSLGLISFLTNSAIPALAQTPAPPPNAQSVPQSSSTIQPLLPEYPLTPKKSVEVKIQKSQPLSLKEAIEIAVQRSPTLLISKLGADRSKGTVREADAGKLPTLESNARYTYSETAQSKLSQGGGGGLAAFFGFGSTGNNGASSSLTGNILQANWNAYTSGRVEAQIEAAQQGLKDSTLEVEKQLQDLKVGVARAYFALQRQDGQVEITQSAVRNAEASLRDTEAQERAGVGTKFDVLRQQVQVARTRQRLLQAQNDRVVAQRDLARALNFVEPTSVSAKDPIEESGGWDLSLEDSIFQAYNKRVELPQFVAREKQAKAQEQLAYARLGPQLSLNGAVDFANQFGNNSSNTGGQVGYSLGAQLQWSFFDGGAAQGQAEQAVAAAKIARVNFTNSNNRLRFEVEQQFSTLQTNREQISTNKQAQGQAEEALRLARLRFKSGVGTQTEVINTEDALTQAKVDLLTSVISYNQSLAELRRAVGIL